MIFSSLTPISHKNFMKTATMQIVSGCCALFCSFLQLLLVSERAKWTLPRHTSATAAVKTAERWCVYILRLFCFLLLFERFKIDRLRARIAALENASAAGNESMQIDDDDVDILTAFAPPAIVAAVSNAAFAKKVRIKLLRRIIVSTSTYFCRNINVKSVTKALKQPATSSNTCRRTKIRQKIKKAK